MPFLKWPWCRTECSRKENSGSFFFARVWRYLCRQWPFALQPLLSSRDTTEKTCHRRHGNSATRSSSEQGHPFTECVWTGCRIDAAEIQRIYDEGAKTWTLSDETLKRNAMDVQRFVDCAAEDDTLLFVTESRVQPYRHIVINKRLTLTGATVDSREVNGGKQHSKSYVSFTCPSELKGVFVIE